MVRHIYSPVLDEGDKLTVVEGQLYTGHMAVSAATQQPPPPPKIPRDQGYTPLALISSFAPLTPHSVWPSSGVQTRQVPTPVASPFYLRHASDAAYIETKRVLAARFADAAGASPLVGLAAVLAEEVREKLHWLSPVDAHLPKNQYPLQWSVRMAQESEEELEAEFLEPPRRPGAE